MTCSVYKFTDHNFEEKNGCVPCASVCNELSVLNSGIYPTAGFWWVSKETHDAWTGCVPELREWRHGLQGYSFSLLSAIKPVHVCHLQCCLFSLCCLKLLRFLVVVVVWWWYKSEAICKTAKSQVPSRCDNNHMVIDLITSKSMKLAARQKQQLSPLQLHLAPRRGKWSSVERRL